MKCKIIKNFWTRNLEFLFYEERGGETYVLEAPPGGFTYTKISVGSTMKPSLIVPIELEDDFQFLKSMLVSITELGIQPDNEHKVHGLLEAQTKHLEDLRHLLKLK